MKVIVPNYVNADDANRLYGEGYGVDWEYESGAAPTGQHTTQDNYEHFLAYSGLDHAPLLQYAYFHGADVGMDKP